MHRIIVLAFAVIACATTAWAQTTSSTGCVDAKAAPRAPTSSEGTAAGASGKGTDAGVAKDGPGTTGWSSGSSEAGIAKDGKSPAAEAKHPETAKGLDPTKPPC